MTYSVIQSFLPNSICYLNFLANNEGAYIHGGQILGAVLHGRLMIRSCQGWGSFTNVLSGNLKTLYKFKIFASHEGIYTHLRIKPWPVYRIMEVFILGANS